MSLCPRCSKPFCIPQPECLFHSPTYNELCQMVYDLTATVAELKTTMQPNGLMAPPAAQPPVAAAATVLAPSLPTLTEADLLGLRDHGLKWLFQRHDWGVKVGNKECFYFDGGDMVPMTATHVKDLLRHISKQLNRRLTDYAERHQLLEDDPRNEHADLSTKIFDIFKIKTVSDLKKIMEKK